MAGVREYIVAKLKRVGVELGSAELDALLIDQGFDISSGEPIEYQAGAVAKQAKAAMLQALSDILVMPDISEGDMSIKYDRGAITTYCAVLRTELGLSSTDTPIVTDASFRW